MAAAEFLLTKPLWTIANTLILPILSDDNGDGKPSLRSLVSLSLPITIFLDSILGEPKAGRSPRTLGEDQLQIFRSLEGSLASLGVDGRGCLLRLICELQQHPIGQFTVIGEILTVLFTPKRGLNDFLHEYIEAEIIGVERGDCALQYDKCPFSLVAAIIRYNEYSQAPPTASPSDLMREETLVNDVIKSNDVFNLPNLVLNGA